MSDQVEPADAARALSEIGRRREQVIRRKVFPGWFWWAQAVLTVALTAAIESQRGVLIGIGITLFAAGSLVINVPVSRAARAAPPHRSLASQPGSARKTLLGLATFMVVLLGVALATGLSLGAAGVPYPGTIAAAVASVVFAVGGPMGVRAEQAMLVRRAGSQG
ncbi:MAG TPA: hypothetical protein VH352_03750 [Pseudonocardiaceae bacterium]|jgi:hypothetical protein|nr:hypothetical protein [Pseudonocardiaceae bacterium]